MYISTQHRPLDGLDIGQRQQGVEVLELLLAIQVPDHVGQVAAEELQLGQHELAEHAVRDHGAEVALHGIGGALRPAAPATGPRTPARALPEGDEAVVAGDPVAHHDLTQGMDAVGVIHEVLAELLAAAHHRQVGHHVPDPGDAGLDDAEPLAVLLLDDRPADPPPAVGRIEDRVEPRQGVQMVVGPGGGLLELEG
ncbi:MAG: hypothetical protein L6R48_15515 [Planctomycetes bacterium]|nr:hypothetical protein [Planctomycetota bacterium]